MVPVHLLVLIHGMWGNPGHLAELHRIAQETYALPLEDGTKLEILLAETNREEGTYDGIDWGGERVAKELLEKVKELESSGDQVTKLSVTGYSLGGLVARYLVGILHQRGFFENVKPINFNTIATPHIGLLRYPSFFSSVTHTLGPRLLSRTGEQFYGVDKWSPNGRPLLLVMADPDRIFYQALTKFQHLRIYANAINDITVPYVTSAIELEDPFAEYETNGVEIAISDEHKHLIHQYSISDNPPPPPAKVRTLSKAWFKRVRSRPPIFPPALQFRFPFNLVMYGLLPILVPTFLSLVIVNFTLASHSSRARIKDLEADSSNANRLAHILAELEREMEGAVIDLIDSDDPEPTQPSKTPVIKKGQHPILTSNQKKIVTWMNTLPGLKKELAFFPNVRNAHAMIVSRDVKRFEAHRLGENVIRHWASSLII
ncbi:hypothetical protein EST38_g4176 [Candolleomyces aberdarensis]|uniref:DUF676 domain-containing protein n=1 Tax=Candolleomyces aberdarensis TaxID=2316362 RepID=A0A4V1Q4D2_9AGAR|nr:hypothetical protein EST38_g4176 [Candolleomyces aberdarensis]